MKEHQMDHVGRCAYWRSRGRARWYHGDESDIVGCGGRVPVYMMLSTKIFRHRFKLKCHYYLAWFAETAQAHVPGCCCTFGALERAMLAEGWCNRFAQKRRTKSEPFTFQTWVLVDGQLSRMLCGCHIAANARFFVCKLVAWRIACINRCCVAAASLRPRPLTAGSHTEACRSICQDAAQAHP